MPQLLGLTSVFLHLAPHEEAPPGPGVGTLKHVPQGFQLGLVGSGNLDGGLAGLWGTKESHGGYRVEQPWLSLQTAHGSLLNWSPQEAKTLDLDL